MADYIITAKLHLDTTNVDAELKKPRTIPIKANITGADKLNIQADTLINRLNRIKIANTDAFKNPEIRTQHQDMLDLAESVRTGEISYQKAGVEVGKFNNDILKVNESIRTTTKSSDNFITTLTKDMGKVLLWGVATGAVYGVIRSIESGIQYLKDLDKELTNIQLVTGQTTEEVYKLADSFNKMAIELGVSTLDVTKGATEWIRQGRSMVETMELLRNSTMLSKLGNLQAADATTKLTAVTNAYKISAKESIEVIDTLVGLDNAFATSTGEISDAMEESSSMARQAGIEYQNLASYITIISSITRQSGDTIGNAIKSISARMLSVKAGVDFDEQGESVNNVEKVLKRYDIALRDSTMSFRDLDDVLAEAAKKYNELGKAGDTVAQGQITTALAGLRQANYLAALFQNWDQVTKAQDIAADSMGLAKERYDIYLDGIESKSNAFVASWEGFWKRFIESDVIKKVVDLGTLLFTPSYSFNINNLGLDETSELLLKTKIQLNELLSAGPIDKSTALVVNQLSSDLQLLQNRYDELINKNDSASASFEKWTGDLEGATTAVQELSGETPNLIQSFEELSKKSDSASSDIKSGFDAMRQAMQEYNDQGQYSIATANALAEAGYAEAVSVNAVTGEVSINISLLQRLAIEQINAAIKALENAKAQAILEGATSATTVKIAQQINALNAQKKALSGEFVDTKSLLGVLNSFTGAKISSAGASGGATEASKQAKKAYEEEKKSINDQVDALKDQKKALQDNLKSYKDIIDAQKQKLQRDKEESDYLKDLEDKNKDIADIDRELLELQFDNSEEANAKRLQLEEERAKATEDLAQYQADRTYDIETQALDDEYDAFERVINLQLAGIDAMIDKYSEMIDKISEAISALSELNSAGGGGGYVAPSTRPVSTPATNISRAVWDSLIQQNRQRRGGYSSGGMGKIPAGHPNDSALLPVESDEAFIIFNKQQQEMMSKNSFFPSIKFPSLSTSGTGGEGGISIGDIVFQVSGNMDKSVVPQIKPLILDAVNDALKNRGIRRNATSMAI